jgi:hypothetical protein
MAAAAPSPDEILQLAEQIVELAAQKRAKYELCYAPESNDPANNPNDTTTPARANGDGSKADYAALRSQYSWVPGFFSNSLGPDPSGFDGPMQTMTATVAKLCNLPSKGGPPAGGGEVQKAYDFANTKIGQWHSDAARTFQANFLVKIPDAAGGQANIAWSLRNALELDQALYVQGRIDLRDIAQKTVDALNAINGSGGSGSIVGLAAASAVLTVVAGGLTPLTGGASLVAAATIGAGLTAAGSTYESTRAGGNGGPLGADTVDGVLGNMTKAVSKSVVKAISDGEQEIVKGLSGAYNQLTGTARNDIVPPKPAVLDVVKLPTRDAENAWGAIN